MSEIKLIIDGKEVQTKAGETILNAALENGIYIPHLCSKEELHPAGACRLCMVEIAGREGVVPSCATRAEEGMHVNTHSPAAEEIRKLCCDFIFKRHPPECTGCVKYGKCQLQSISQYVGDTGIKLRAAQLEIPENTQDPVICHDMQRCILCGRCVRVCADYRGVGVLKMKKVDGRLRVVVDGDNLNISGCRYCSACVEVCPTGSIREQEAIAKHQAGKTREHALIPCLGECPAHIDVPKYIRFIKEKRYDDAAATIREKAPLPWVLGYVCDHPCEGACKHACLNEAISIRALKQFAAQQDKGSWKEHLETLAPTGKKIAVIGSGPAGLTTAWLLRRKGHGVTIFEKEEKAGGQLRYGIPKHRLPREVLDQEIDTLLELGIQLELEHPIQSAPALLQQGFDAVFVAVGTHRGVQLPITGADLRGVYLNTALLKAAEKDDKVELGSSVIVLGGGNVALDCAAVARRLGAETVYAACLEGCESMTASTEELQIAKEEGLIILNSRTFDQILGQDGTVAGISMRSVRTFEFDETGKAILDIISDSEETIQVDSVIFAVGQRPDVDASFGLPLGRGNRIATLDGTATEVEGIFAAGDCVDGTTSVIKAIAAGRSAAEQIDRFVGGDGNVDFTIVEQNTSPILGRAEAYGQRKRKEADILPVQDRVKSFSPILKDVSEELALYEADRCLQCDLRTDIAPQTFWSDYEKDVKG